MWYGGLGERGSSQQQQGQQQGQLAFSSDGQKASTLLFTLARCLPAVAAALTFTMSSEAYSNLESTTGGGSVSAQIGFISAGGSFDYNKTSFSNTASTSQTFSEVRVGQPWWGMGGAGSRAACAHVHQGGWVQLD